MIIRPEHPDDYSAILSLTYEAFLTRDYPGRRRVDEHYLIHHKLTLRPLFEDDVALVERWIYTPHVAQWYNNPEHWLNELHGRRGAFSFIKHFIAELEGAPFGFCQYYDRFFTQRHEARNDEWRMREKQGEVFSIDYLIGVPDYLRRGLGKEMIAQTLCMIKNWGK